MPGRRWSERAGRVVVGGLLAVVGVALVVAGLQWAGPQLHKVRGYRTAPACAHGESVTGDVGCVTRTTGTVLGRTVTTHYDPPSCTTNTDPTTHTTTTTCTGGSTRYSYSVEFAGPGGDKADLDVGHGFYRAAEKGSEARLRYWRGQIVAATIGSHSERFTPNSMLALVLFWLITWVGAGLVLAGTYGMVSRDGCYAEDVPRALGWWSAAGGFVCWAAAHITTYGLGPVMLGVLSALGALVPAVGAVVLRNMWADRRRRRFP